MHKGERGVGQAKAKEAVWTNEGINWNEYISQMRPMLVKMADTCKSKQQPASVVLNMAKRAGREPKLQLCPELLKGKPASLTKVCKSNCQCFPCYLCGMELALRPDREILQAAGAGA